MYAESVALFDLMCRNLPTYKAGARRSLKKVCSGVFVVVFVSGVCVLASSLPGGGSSLAISTSGQGKGLIQALSSGGGGGGGGHGAYRDLTERW